MSAERNRKDHRALGLVLLVLGFAVMVFGGIVWRIQTNPCVTCFHAPHVELPCIEEKPDGFKCGCRRDR